ncbi:hypothetical protein HDV05_007853 [Chytridiales sp. JEL 0842]|nr:hypothetical protein HDV05_007853 [Chytridiales sp. JEL 0842]
MSETQLYGLDKELAEKAASKFDPQMEADVKWFIETVTGEKFSSDDFQESLKDGVLLCKLINKIDESISGEPPIKFATSRMPFKQMENIGKFLERIGKLGVPAYEQFQTVDLFESKNPQAVINCLFSVSRHAAARGFQGPLLGPKLATKNERHFSEEQLAASKSTLPKLHSFTNPNAATIVFSGRREIGGVYLDKPLGAFGSQDEIKAATMTAKTTSSASGSTRVSVGDLRDSMSKVSVNEPPGRMASIDHVVEKEEPVMKNVEKEQGGYMAAAASTLQNLVGGLSWSSTAGAATGTQASTEPSVESAPGVEPRAASPIKETPKVVSPPPAPASAPASVEETYDSYYDEEEEVVIIEEDD